MIKYDFKSNPWQVVEQNFPYNRDAKQKLSFLLRYAILAPSSHNTQPWKFAVTDEEILVFANLDRWLQVADRDQRELYISIGCAIENLLVAAEHFGFGHTISYFPEPDNRRLVAAVRFMPEGEPSAFRSREMFDAIFVRHTNHKEYEPRTIAQAKLERISSCVVEDGVTLFMTGSLEIKRKVDALVNRADAIQFRDPAFREELAYWIGQGVFGTPWLLAKLSQLAVSYLDMGKIMAKKDSDVLMSAPVLGLICSRKDDRETQVKVGQVFERIYLTAAVLGLAIQPMSQIVQIPEIKSELRELIPLAGLFPQQPFRLGYAEPEKGHTPRRPIEEAIA
ncbi:MAG TPA: nitroreductase [Blastocatellia bacterium]|nr:nitroreductase [Blastocatellia bacterium]